MKLAFKLGFTTRAVFFNFFCLHGFCARVRFEAGVRLVSVFSAIDESRINWKTNREPSREYFTAVASIIAPRAIDGEELSPMNGGFYVESMIPVAGKTRSSSSFLSLRHMNRGTSRLDSSEIFLARPQNLWVRLLDRGSNFGCQAIRFIAYWPKLEVKGVAVSSHSLLTSALESALGSHLCVALSSAQVLWVRSHSA